MGWYYLSIPKFQRYNFLNGAAVEFHSPLYQVCDYSSILGLKSIHVSTRGPSAPQYNLLWGQWVEIKSHVRETDWSNTNKNFFECNLKEWENSSNWKAGFKPIFDPVNFTKKKSSAHRSHANYKNSTVRKLSLIKVPSCSENRDDTDSSLTSLVFKFCRITKKIHYQIFVITHLIWDRSSPCVILIH